MRTLARRLTGIPPTIFTQMSAHAARFDAVNLGQGFPDRDGPASVIAAAHAGLDAGENQYPPGRGRPALRQAIAAHQRRHYGIELDPEREIAVTTGATEAIAAAMLGLLEPGDEVVMCEPYYDSYAAAVSLAGGVRRPVPLRFPDSRLDLTALRAAVTDRTAMILLNTPHNPTGRVLDRDELAGVAALAREHDLVVVADEVYEHLVFDGARHLPIATFPGMAPRTLTISSVGKSWSFTGWKVGWVSGSAPLVDAVVAAKQWLTFASAAPLQSAVAYAIDAQSAWPAELARELATRRDLLCDGLTELGLPTARPQGTYFALSDISALGWADGHEFCEELPRRAGVAAIPVAALCDDPAVGGQLVRWAFCKEPDLIEEALSRLRRADLTR